MSVDSGLCTVARLLTGIQERANHSFALGMYALNSNSLAKSVVSNFWRSPRVASPRNFARARVYFARPTIAIAKIRDYSQSSPEGSSNARSHFMLGVLCWTSIPSRGEKKDSQLLHAIETVAYH